MNSPCDICIEEQCKGKKECDCENCELKNTCNKKLNFTIRITDICTQECSHCCFSCSPNSKKVMSVENSIILSKFLNDLNVNSINIMGGEFFKNPDWEEIFNNLILDTNIPTIRLVSNGDWAKDKDFVKKFLPFKDRFYVAISNDMYHTNAHVYNAIDYLKENNIFYSEDNGYSEEAIVPVGRATYDCSSIYGLFGTYCRNPKYLYSHLIDEDLNVFKCPFGLWEYYTIEDNFVKEDFRKEFKKISRTFYKTFIPSCTACYRAYQKNRKEHNNIHYGQL